MRKRPFLCPRQGTGMSHCQAYRVAACHTSSWTRLDKIYQPVGSPVRRSNVDQIRGRKTGESGTQSQTSKRTRNAPSLRRNLVMAFISKFTKFSLPSFFLPFLSTLPPLHPSSLFLILLFLGSFSILFVRWLYDAIDPLANIMNSPTNDAASPSFNNADQPDSQRQLLQHDSTLTVARSVSLTLGSDALLVAGRLPIAMAVATWASFPF